MGGADNDLGGVGVGSGVGGAGETNFFGFMLSCVCVGRRVGAVVHVGTV